MSRTLRQFARLSAANPVPDRSVDAFVPACWREELLDRILREPTPRDERIPHVRPQMRLRVSALTSEHQIRRLRFRPVVFVVVAALLALGGAVAFAAPVRETLDQLGAWLDHAPGETSPEHQNRFEEQNATPYGRFPEGTTVGLLLRQRVGHETFQLMGFRAGERLCLRLETSAEPTASRPPECVSAWELARTDEPAAILAGQLPAYSDGHPRPIVYGFVADRIRRMEVEVDGMGRGEAAIAYNAFLYVGEPVDTDRLGIRSVTATAFDKSGQRSEIAVSPSPLENTVPTRRLPGPNQVERSIEHGRIDWLERAEPRGEPFDWPKERSWQILYARTIQPDPTSPFRLAVAYAEGSGQTTVGKFYCFKWLWPLIANPGSTSCIRSDAIASGVAYTAELPNSGEQFPLWVGVAADEIERLELYYSEDVHRNIRIVDNVFAFQTRRGEPVKLVAYDHSGRVVKVGPVGSPDSGLSGFSVSP